MSPPLIISNSSPKPAYALTESERSENAVKKVVKYITKTHLNFKLNKLNILFK